MTPTAARPGHARRPAYQPVAVLLVFRPGRALPCGRAVLYGATRGTSKAER